MKKNEIKYLTKLTILRHQKITLKIISRDQCAILVLKGLISKDIIIQIMKIKNIKVYNYTAGWRDEQRELILKPL